MLLNRVRDWRGGEAVLAKREWSDSGTPESPTPRERGNAQRIFEERPKKDLLPFCNVADDFYALVNAKGR